MCAIIAYRNAELEIQVNQEGNFQFYKIIQEVGTTESPVITNITLWLARYKRDVFTLCESVSADFDSGTEVCGATELESNFAVNQNVELISNSQ